MKELIFDKEYSFLTNQDNSVKVIYINFLIILIIIILLSFFSYQDYKKHKVIIKNNEFKIVINDQDLSNYFDADLVINKSLVDYEINEVQEFKLANISYNILTIKIIKPNIYKEKQNRYVTFKYSKTSVIKYIFKTMKGWFK